MHGSMHTDGASNHPSRVPPNLPSSHHETPRYSNLPASENLLAIEPSTPPSGEESYPLTSTTDPQLDTGDTTIATMDGRSLVAEGPDLNEETLVEEGERNYVTEQPMSPQTFMPADKEMTTGEGDFVEAAEEEDFEQQMNDDYLEAKEEQLEAMRSSARAEQDGQAAEAQNVAEESTQGYLETVADALDVEGRTKGLEIEGDYLEAIDEETSGQQMAADYLEAMEEREKAIGSSTWEDEDLEATEDRADAIGSSTWEDEDLEATEDRAKATGSSTWEDEDLEATEERAKATGSSIQEDEDFETAELHNQAEEASLDKTKTVADTFDIGGQTKGLEAGGEYIEAMEEEASVQHMTADFLEAAEEQLEVMRSSGSENKDMEADVTSLGKLETAVDALDARGHNRDPEVNPKMDWLDRVITEEAGILVEAVTSEDELYSAEPLEDGSGSRKQGPTFKGNFLLQNIHHSLNLYRGCGIVMNNKKNCIYESQSSKSGMLHRAKMTKNLWTDLYL